MHNAVVHITERRARPRSVYRATFERVTAMSKAVNAASDTATANERKKNINVLQVVEAYNSAGGGNTGLQAVIDLAQKEGRVIPHNVVRNAINVMRATAISYGVPEGAITQRLEPLDAYASTLQPSSQGKKPRYTIDGPPAPFKVQRNSKTNACYVVVPLRGLQSITPDTAEVFLEFKKDSITITASVKKGKKGKDA